MNVLVFIATWKRPAITELCLQSLLEHLPVTWQSRILLLVSDDANKEVADRYQTERFYVENEPLGWKMNQGLRYALDNIDFEWLLQLNSDAIVTGKFFDLVRDQAEYFQHKVFGLNKVTFIDMFGGAKVGRVTEDEIFGSGRVIHRSVLQPPVWQDEKNNRLDYTSNVNLRKNGAKIHPVNTPGNYLLDFKSDVNIWPMEKAVGEEVDYRWAMENVSTTDKKRICRLAEEITK